MKVFISADIEGTTLTTHWEQTRTLTDARAREHCRQMTDEVRAACEGAIAAGASQIVVKDAHGKGIDAGGDGHDQHGLEGKGGVHRFLFLGKGFANHVRADQSQKDEGDPVVDGGDVLLEDGTEKVADGGHQRLKTAEPQSDDGHLFPVQFPGGEALADGDGEGVHRKADGEQKQAYETHEKPFLLRKITKDPMCILRPRRKCT